MDLEIYDCTLREGEQAAGASFSLQNRIELFKKLDEFGIDYIELGWPAASKEIFDSFEICEKIRTNSKIVAFGSTSIAENPQEDKNLKLIIETKAKYACIFGKSSAEHVEKQLKITKDENIKKISGSIKFLRENGLHVFYDAEHYFDGFKSDTYYSLETLSAAIEAGAEIIILCDTNGGTLPSEAEKIIKETKERFPKISFGVHFHNDSGLALSNTLACLPYINQVQGTINGIGERVGNLNFSEFLPVYMKKMKKELKINLKELKKINEDAFRLSGIDIPKMRAFVGDNSFAHKGGIHIDAISKGASYEHENPEDFGNRRIIFLNTLGGRVGIINIAKKFGYTLDKDECGKKIEELYSELREYESNGYDIGAMNAEQFLIIEKYFGNLNEFFRIIEWKTESEMKEGNEKSTFYAKIKINDEMLENEMTVDGGPVDAAYKTIKNLLVRKYPELDDIKLFDFHVSIARSQREESSVRTAITFMNDEVFETAGVDRNIITSAIEAISKGFNYYLNASRKEA